MSLQAGLCRTWLATPKTGFLVMQLIFEKKNNQRHRSVCVHLYSLFRCFTANIVSIPKFQTPARIFSSPEPKAHKVSLLYGMVVEPSSVRP